MAPHKISIRVGAWFSESDINLSFPASWEVQECRMAGHDLPALSGEQMRAAMHSPIGTARLSELARGKREAIILFDDLPKPTPASAIVPHVLDELHEGGIADEQIRFLCAPGTHRPLIYPELVAKLGEDVLAKYPVYNHSIWENLAYIGTTSRGTPVHVNREYAKCDLRVAIGSVFPHPLAGFGGGGKIILPGIAGIETIDAHHKLMREGPEKDTATLGRVEGNAFRDDIEEAALMARLDFKVDSVLNNHRQVVGLFAGDVIAAHRAGVKLAREVYHTIPAKDADVLVINGYPDEMQFVRSTWCVPLSLREGGDAVLITHSHEGQNLHQWAGRFGNDYGGRGWMPGGRAKHLAKAGRVLVLAPHLSKYDAGELGTPEKIVWCRDWGEVLAHLVERHGAGAKVAVYPYAAMQMESKS